MSAQRCPSCGAPVAGARFCGTCGMRLVQPAAPPVRDAAAPAAVSGRSAPHPPGTILDRRYRIVSSIASGSMGAVYRAEDLRLGGKPRALKELLQHWGTEAERGEAEVWFRREGETLMNLQHPAIPLVHDTFSDGARHYLVMDLVEGCSLEQVLLDEGRPGLPEERVTAWADQMLDVLSYLHSRSDPLIFRDLKPANVMLTPSGKIRLIDFGIARVFTQQRQGTAIGTPGYAPPEQYQGLAEPASDLYALGATVHHLLTGRDPRKSRPFDFPPILRLAPEVSQTVALAIDRALSLDPRARYGTAAEMRKALHASPSGTMPRLTISGSLARGSTGPMPVPVRPVLPIAVDPADAAVVDPRAVRLRPREVEIACAGNRIATKLDNRTVRLRNRSKARIHCVVDSDAPWLLPDPPAFYLAPGGRQDIGLAVVSPVPPVGTHHAALRISGGGQTWGTQVRLRVRGRSAVAVRTTSTRLRRLAELAVGLSLVALLLDWMSVHVVDHSTAFHVLVVGLIGSVVLRVLRGGKGP